MTFLLIAHCARTQQFCIVVSSASIAVRAVDPVAAPGYGVPGDPR
ncbi:MAG: hypothetical protein WCJ87_12485 [Burkholderiales bacterium]|jgi:uncharacterized Ntn-hydrolase superfamily protein